MKNYSTLIWFILLLSIGMFGFSKINCHSVNKSEEGKPIIPDTSIKKSVIKKSEEQKNKKINNSDDSLTIDEVIAISHFCHDKLKIVDSLLFTSTKSKILHTGFDFFSKSFSQSDSSSLSNQGNYSAFSSYKNMWHITYSDLKYRYNYHFYDTLNISIGVCSVTYYNPAANSYTEREAPGVLLLFKKNKLAYFIGLYASKFTFSGITTIMQLKGNLLPERQIRFGRMAGDPPETEFISKFIYDKGNVYKNEVRLTYPEALKTYTGSTKFFTVVYSINRTEDYSEIGFAKPRSDGAYFDLLLNREGRAY